MSEWLDNVKAGDEVAYRSGHWARWELLRVLRVTPTQLVLRGERRFRRKDGRYIGSASWHTRPVIAEPTEGIRREIWRKDAEERLANVQWQTKPDAVLRTVLSALALDEAQSAASPHCWDCGGDFCCASCWPKHDAEGC